MERDKAKEFLARKLVDLKPFHRGRDQYYLSYRTIGSNLTSQERLPYPYMVYLTLVDILEFPFQWKPMEKTLWSISVSFKNVPILIEQGKFGLRVSSSEPDRALPILAELYRVLLDAFKITDRVFGQVVKQKIQAGEVTVPNSFNHLRQRYHFLRLSAENSFNSTPPADIVIQSDEKGNPTGWSMDRTKPKREGYYFAAAAIDAYFSFLEHFLIAAYAFISYRPGKDDLQGFISSIWSDKYRTIYDFEKEIRANQVYDKLMEIKRTYRNKFAHGGLDRDGGSLFIHHDHLGPISAKLSAGFESSIYPIDQMGFADVCQGFDLCDEFLAEGSASAVWTYLNCGFDVAFDSGSIREYKKYSGMDKRELEASLEALGYVIDANINMEW